jgi:16S rRNA (uracil1498-N3)-methyltransferase
MADRYFVASPIQGDRATLAGTEAHHLSRVMRAKVGDEVLLFDGSGREFAARVERIDRNAVELSVGPARTIDREAKVRVTLGVALPKGDRQRWLVEKSVELGLARIVPLTTARGVAQPTASALERLERAVIEATKQCGRNRLLEITPSRTWREYLGEAPTTACRLVAHPSQGEAAGIFREAVAPGLFADGAELYFAVGPEGGLTDGEISESLAQGWRMVELGPRILRVETAVLAMAAYCTLASR